MFDDGLISSNRRILCVDLDGTLVHSDLLLESLLWLLRLRPIYIFLLPLWVWRGKAHLKAQIASRIDFTNARLPLNHELIEYIQEAKQSGAYVVLVTGSHQSLADSVASGVVSDLFDEVQGTSGTTNLTNVRKRDWLIERFGKNGFDYIGNDTDDLAVWPDADKALVVSSKKGIVTRTAIKFDTVFETPTVTWRDYLSLIRVHQWSKNLLVLVPFFLDARFSDVNAIIAISCAFLAMSLLASATYIINDMFDLQADRQNKIKAKRMLASGRVPLLVGMQVVTILLIATFTLMFFLPIGFNIVLGVYAVTTLYYSLDLKRRAMIDVIVLAGLHTIRVIAGTLAIAAAWSFWLLAFSMFIFFSLALSKRVAELINLKREGKSITAGRNYSVEDIPILQTMGVTAGLLSVLVVALFINGQKVLETYQNPMLLWLVCPVLMYWIGRLWLITARGFMHEDPIVFVMRDAISRVAVLCILSVIIMAMYM